MRSDCHICQSEGFEAHNRILVTVKGATIIATLNTVTNSILRHNEASLSESAWKALNAEVGDEVSFAHMQPVISMRDVRAKMYGKRLDKNAFLSIIKDIVNSRYSNIEIAAFITACAGDNLSIEEITGLTDALVNTGQKLSWNKNIVVDKHCVGGLPGNRTTPIVVSIVAAAGLTIPKTSSRAITSPAGTADTMETMTPVDLSLEQIKKVVGEENGCFVWGGSVKLSPADDILIRIERALDVDSEGQMIASVLSKKAAAGSTHVLIDIPVGETAKVRTEPEAEKLKYYFSVVGKALGLKVHVLQTDGSQPIGHGIGPSLEAIDVLHVLRNEKNAPEDLKEKSIMLAGTILELSGLYDTTEGLKHARNILESGKAWEKFLLICKAQGGFKEPGYAPFKHDIIAGHAGEIREINNREIAKIAKLAGAPSDKTAGVLLQAKLNHKVKKGDILYTIFAEHKGKLSYVLDYVKSESDVISIE